jgi:hypothetical protein
MVFIFLVALGRLRHQSLQALERPVLSLAATGADGEALPVVCLNLDEGLLPAIADATGLLRRGFSLSRELQLLCHHNAALRRACAQLERALHVYQRLRTLPAHELHLFRDGLGELQQLLARGASQVLFSSAGLADYLDELDAQLLVHLEPRLQYVATAMEEITAIALCWRQAVENGSPFSCADATFLDFKAFQVRSRLHAC